MLWLLTFSRNYKQERSSKNTSLQVCDIQILGFKQFFNFHNTVKIPNDTSTNNMFLIYITHS